MDFLTPKIRRLQGRAEEMSVTPFWPIDRLKVVGDGPTPCNSLSDFVCRMIGELKRKQNEQTNEDEDWEMTPWSLVIAEQSMETGCEGMQHFSPEVKDELGFGPQNVHRWWLDGYKEWVRDAWSLAITHQKDGAPGEGVCHQVPTGFTEKRLALADEPWARIAQGYSNDEKSAHGGLLIKIFYDVGCGTFAGPNVVANDASALLGKMFFTVNVGCNEDMTVLYTIREAVRNVCGVLPGTTKGLVLVVPMDMQVYISKLTADNAVYGQEEAPEWAKKQHAPGYYVVGT